LTVEEIIQSEIAKAGGILNLNDLDPTYKNYLEMQTDRFQKACNNIVDQVKSITKITVKIIDNFGVNAFAVGADGVYFIGINRGLMATVSLIFSRLFADKQFMNFVGDVSQEDENLVLIPNLYPNFEATVDTLPSFSPPKNLIRKEYARLFSWLALDFTIAHELGHIIRGHCDYYLKKMKLNLDEVSKLSEKQEFKLERKVLEMDADRWACTMLLSTELNRCMGKLGIPGDHWKNVYKNPGMVLLNYSTIVSTVFKIFGDLRLDYIPFEEQTYPVPRIRKLISSLRIANHPDFKSINSKMKYDVDSDGVPIHVEMAFRSVEQGFKLVTGKDQDEKSANLAKGKEGRRQINILRKHWNDIVIEKLRTHSHIKLNKIKLLNKEAASNRVDGPTSDN